MKDQSKLINEGDWDTLIILDACRFDFFEDIYKEYLSGSLQKVKSAGSTTAEWLRKTFKGREWDFVYVSGTPQVNSRGVEVFDAVDASAWFYRVMDAWDKGYDQEKGTILPAHVREVGRIARVKYPDRRLLVHFNQPHEPYLSVDHIKSIMGVHLARGNRFERYLAWIKKYLKGFVGLRDDLKFVEKLHEEGRLRKAYSDNLEIVLKEVKKMISGWGNMKIVVSSDHGELLGEEGKFRHPAGSDHPVLREVPWLKVEK